MRVRAYFLLIGLLLSGVARAAIETYHFSSLEQEQEYRSLTESLRCPKCQNNSIADSSAMIATDMRDKVYQLMQQGQSRQQIIDYMIARYGNFISYQPPLTASTLILWLGPLIVVIGGGVLIFLQSRRRASVTQLDVAQQQRLQQLLDDAGKGQ